MKLIFSVVLLILATSLSCSKKSGSSGSSTNSTSLTVSYPTELAVSSPTANKAATMMPMGAPVGAMAFDSDASFEEKKEAIKAILAGSSATACKVILPHMVGGNNPSCFGPMLYYVNHPNSTYQDSNSVHDNLTNPNFDDNDFELPTGDLGLWTATEANGTACAAAKMNSEIHGIARKVDNALLVAASMSCLMKVNGTALPAIDGAVDLTTDIQTALGENNTNISITTATLSRLADSSSGHPVYQYHFEVAFGGIFNQTVSVYLKHSPEDATNSTYVGRLWSRFSGGSGFSLNYEKTSTKVRYRMHSANFTNGASEATMFNTDGTMKLGQGTWTGNIALTQTELDPTDGTGSASYAWQAGSGDSDARIFNAYTTKSGTDTLAFGFFGYGLRFDQTANGNTGSSSDGIISKFICNWAGPGNSHTGVASKAQKQMMKRVSGKFVPFSASGGDPNLIDYAPLNSCNVNANSVDANGQVFQYSTTNNAWTGSQPAVANKLISLSSDTEYSGYTAPTAPTAL